jgi:hypothetical protein
LPPRRTGAAAGFFTLRAAAGLRLRETPVFGAAASVDFFRAGTRQLLLGIRAAADPGRRPLLGLMR